MGNVIQQDDKKYDVFKIAKRMFKTNQDIIGEQCIRNDNGVLAVSDEDKKYLGKVMRSFWTQSWDKNILSQVDKFSDKDMVRKSIIKVKNGKAAGLLDLVSEIAAGKAGADLITDIVNQIIVEKKLWCIFMYGVQLPQGYRATSRRQFTFHH